MGVFVTTKPKTPISKRTPLPMTLTAMESAQSRGIESYRVTRQFLRPDTDPRYASILLSPHREMRRPVVVLIDWTRTGRVQSLALPIYGHDLRRAFGDDNPRLSRDFYWLLHYPRRALELFAFDAALAQISDFLDEMTEERLTFWREVLRMRLTQCMTAHEIAASVGQPATRINALLREAYMVFRRSRVTPNPMDPFRFGQDRWGAFRMGWDMLTEGYVLEPDIPPTPEQCAQVADLIGSIAWESGSAFDLQPVFDRALPSRQARMSETLIDIDVGDEVIEVEGIGMGQLFPDALVDLFGR